MALRYHQRCHTALKPYECPECGLVFKHYSVMEDHRRKHTGNTRSHLCNICGKTFKYSSLLHQHQYLHTGQKPFRCPECGKKFSFGLAYLLHDTPEKSFKCSCGKAFTALMRLKTHQRFSRNSHCNEFYCSECKKAFNSHIALFNHQRWHANHSNDSAKRFPCEECGKVFMTLTFYYRHQRTAHSDETPAKSFLHQVCQLQKKAFECKDCGLKFSRASALHSHQLHHTDVFRETEKEAQMRTSLLPQQETLESERKETEQEEVDSENVLPTSMAEEDLHGLEKKNLACNECGKCFSRLSALVSHQLHHPKRKQFQCPDCMMSYLHAASLFNHMKNCSAQKK
uniref:C2H2-type domain-containing protein n=1 Tax=Sander lucioperca TaxID=283035 RepID=A0A8C9Z784_SANLU